MPNINEINKVIYQSWHRGCREADILLGDYAKAKVPEFDDKKFTLYKELIEENDWDIYNWVVGREDMPLKYKELLIEIKEFSLGK